MVWACRKNDKEKLVDTSWVWRWTTLFKNNGVHVEMNLTGDRTRKLRGERRVVWPLHHLSPPEKGEVEKVLMMWTCTKLRWPKLVDTSWVWRWTTLFKNNRVHIGVNLTGDRTRKLRGERRVVWPLHHLNPPEKGEVEKVLMMWTCTKLRWPRFGQGHYLMKTLW